jgi:hypothetical protein
MTAIDTALASLTIVKTIKYKGADEVYGNTYFFDGTKPASDASWKTLADAVIAEEKVLFPSDVFITSAIGHQAGQSVAVWGYDYLANSAAVAGTYSIGTEYRQAGNVAAWLRWSTTQKTSKGKPIFLRSYYHPAFSAGDREHERRHHLLNVEDRARGVRRRLDSRLCRRRQRRASQGGAAWCGGSDCDRVLLPHNQDTRTAREAHPLEGQWLCEVAGLPLPSFLLADHDMTGGTPSPVTSSRASPSPSATARARCATASVSRSSRWSCSARSS